MDRDGNSTPLTSERGGYLFPRLSYLVLPANVTNPVFSPDGAWIAYTSDESGQHEVFVRLYLAAAGGQRKISSSDGREPVWSRDGTELFYRVEDKMMAVAVQTRPRFSHRTPVELFDGDYQSISVLSTYDVHPDKSVS